jgi:hypothetical protein
MIKNTRKKLMERKIVELLISGKGVNKLSEQLHVCKRRIRNLREQAKIAGYIGGGVTLPPYPEALFQNSKESQSIDSISEADQLLTAHREWIIERLQAGWRAISVFEKLPAKVSRSSFYRFLKRHRIEHKKKLPRQFFPKVSYSPGEMILIDYRKLRHSPHPMTGELRTVWAFVGLLGFSHYRVVRLAWDTDIKTIIELLESILHELGGSSSRITFTSKENPLNPQLERFASYYGTIIEYLPSAHPDKNGKPKRPSFFLQKLYESISHPWDNIEEAQSHLNQKLRLINERRSNRQGRSPIEDFRIIEQRALRPLPQLHYEIEDFQESVVLKDGRVKFKGKRYFVGEHYIKKEVILFGNSRRICIYHNGKLIQTHECRTHI